MFDGYVAAKHLPGSPLDADSVRDYCSRVRQYLARLAVAVEAGAVDGDPLAEPASMATARSATTAPTRSPSPSALSTVNAHLTAVDDFYRHLGLGPANAKRHELPKTMFRMQALIRESSRGDH